MKIDIHKIPEGRTNIVQKTNLEAVKNDMPPLVGDILCNGHIDRSKDTLYMTLHFEGKLKLECSRCLTLSDVPVNGDLMIILQGKTGKSGAAEDDDVADFYFDLHDGEFDLSSALYDEIMTTLPLKPLCSPDCKGIQVGDTDISIDYGNGTKKKQIDPRWEALRKLQERNASEGSDKKSS